MTVECRLTDSVKEDMGIIPLGRLNREAICVECREILQAT